MQKPNYKLDLGREEEARIISAVNLRNKKGSEKDRTFSGLIKEKCDCNQDNCACNEFQEVCDCNFDEEGCGADYRCLIYN